MAQGKGPDKEPIIKPVVYAGINVTQVDGDNINGFRNVGVNTGLGAFIRLPKNLSTSFEVLYSQKGSRTSLNEEINLGTEYKLRLDYIDIPILFNYHDKDRAIFGAGVIVSNLVKSKERYTDQFGNTIEDEDLPYKRTSFEVVANVSFIFIKNFGISLRYQYTLGQMNSRSRVGEPNFIFAAGEGWQRHHYLTARLMYIIDFSSYGKKNK